MRFLPAFPMYRQGMASIIHQTVVPHNKRLERSVIGGVARYARRISFVHKARACGLAPAAQADS